MEEKMKAYEVLFSSPEHPGKSVFLQPMSKTDPSLFYSDDTKDAERGTIGHLRMDMGSSGNEFWTTWWPHNANRLNGEAFRQELDAVVNAMRADHGPLHSLSDMKKFCRSFSEHAVLEANYCFGFTLETDDFQYMLRLTPSSGNYSYLYCYSKSEQQAYMNASTSGLNHSMHDENNNSVEIREHLEDGESKQFIEQIMAETKAMEEEKKRIVDALPEDKQRIVHAMETAGFEYGPLSHSSIDPYVFYSATNSYPLSFQTWEEVYEWIDAAQLKDEPGLRERVQSVLHPER